MKDGAQSEKSEKMYKKNKQKVNFYKSSLVGININQNWIEEAAVVLNCKVSWTANWCNSEEKKHVAVRN
jgi:hypothetical protein